MAAAEVIAMADRVERVNRFDRTGYIGPGDGSRRRAVVEAESELMEVRGKERDAAPG